MRARYGVVRCDEGGTLTDNDGNNIDHTWDVIDRQTMDGYGHPLAVQNCDTRETARRIAREKNEAFDLDPGPYRVSSLGSCVWCGLPLLRSALRLCNVRRSTENLNNHLECGTGAARCDSPNGHEGPHTPITIDGLRLKDAKE